MNTILSLPSVQMAFLYLRETSFRLISLGSIWNEKRTLKSQDFLNSPFYSILNAYIRNGELLLFLRFTVTSNQSDNIILGFLKRQK